MEIFVIHREFIDGHIDIAGPAFTDRAGAEAHLLELLSLEEVQHAVIHRVYLIHKEYVGCD